jgi:hypothetical protein
VSAPARDSALTKAYSDEMYSVRIGGRPALVYVLLEHQSKAHRLMPFRLLKYQVRIWDDWLAEHPDATHLPVIVPVVVHHGAEGWTAARAFEELFDLGESARAALGEHFMRMRFVLDDVRAVGAIPPGRSRHRPAPSWRAPTASGCAPSGAHIHPSRRSSVIASRSNARAASTSACASSCEKATAAS